ncbi:VWA domain-containing protein [Scytonema sp. UIC 10036]|nr:VWA domain-containing protein [Scytonema sp. UIC 10036]
MNNIIATIKDRKHKQNKSHTLSSEKNLLEEFKQEVSMVDLTLDELHNRNVFLLIDQSGSMAKQDAANSDLSRWDSLREMVMGHVNSIFKKKITDSISICLFSRNKFNNEIFKVRNISQVENIFREHEPDQATFIVPTLKHFLDIYFDEEDQPKPQPAFFIIYTDGQFDDREEFEELIKATCKKLDDQRHIKIFIIGVGSEIKNKINKDYFEKLNKNAINNKNKHGKPCDIVGFDIADEMENILKVLENELKQK